jgi:hypothetical protein
MTKSELRAWIRARAITQAEAAALLGLSLPTLVRQITDAPSGVPVGKQTAIICRLITSHQEYAAECDRLRTDLNRRLISPQP